MSFVFRNEQLELLNQCKWHHRYTLSLPLLETSVENNEKPDRRSKQCLETSESVTHTHIYMCVCLVKRMATNQ